MDRVVLVNPQDRKLGEMEKLAAHRGEGKLHRAISVFLFNDQGEVLLQRRSPKKIVGAMQWANTCCGNVRPGETRMQCARRRLKEELGIPQARLCPVHTFTYKVKCNHEFSEHEIDTVFVGKLDSQVFPSRDEVMDSRLEAWDKLKSKVCQDDSDQFAPWFRIMMSNAEIIKEIEKGKDRIYG